mmetsp:Transcript_24797/g.38231  ORF Transcript_24797/g.38231 Transcript_24797/m.38231 type:complete len:213 (+) Transcript_24797:494-1132(+)
MNSDKKTMANAKTESLKTEPTLHEEEEEFNDYQHNEAMDTLPELGFPTSKSTRQVSFDTSVKTTASEIAARTHSLPVTRISKKQMLELSPVAPILEPTLFQRWVSTPENTEEIQQMIPDFDHEIRVREGESPAQHLLLSMVDLKEILANSTNRIMSGLPATKEDWELIREAVLEVGTVFQKRVVFEWEGDDDDDDNHNDEDFDGLLLEDLAR